MPGDTDYVNLGRMIVPLELNYCQCMLELEEYYEVIEHTTELLDKHKGRDFEISVIGRNAIQYLLLCSLLALIHLKRGSIALRFCYPV